MSAFVNQATALDNRYKTVLKNQDTNSWHLKCFRHDCVRSRKTSDRNTQSMKPLEQHQRCKFYVAVSYCPEEKLFYVRKNSGCNFTHHGHPPIPRDQIVLGIKQIPDECRKDTEEMLASHVPIAAVNEMIKIRTNNHVTGDSLKHLRRVVMAAKTGGTIDSNRSPAQLALDILRESKGCNYSYLSASMDRATSLVSIRKGSWKKGKKSTSLVDAASEEEQEPYEAYIDDERKRYVQSVLKSLSLGESFMLCLHLFLHIHISTHLVCIYCSLPIRICARAHVRVLSS